MSTNENGRQAQLAPIHDLDERFRARAAFDNAEAHIAKLVSDLEHVKLDIRELGSAVKDIRENQIRMQVFSERLPTKAWGVSIMFLTAVVIIAAVLILAPRMDVLLRVLR